jgi:hypothetical protein
MNIAKPLSKIAAIALFSAVFACGAGGSKASDVVVEEGYKAGPWFDIAGDAEPQSVAAGAFLSCGLTFHSAPTFSPDGKEAYWSLQDGSTFVLRYSRLEGATWTKPVVPSFSEDGLGDDSPTLSPDGTMIVFVSSRNDAGGPGDKERIWYATRPIGGDWTSPRILPDSVNSMPDIHWQLGLNARGDLFFASGMDTGPTPADIWVAKFDGGTWGNPERLSRDVNSEFAYDGTPYVWPDGSLLVFARLDAKAGRSFLFASAARDDGSWTAAKSIDAIIPPTGFCLCPQITVDGSRVFWLDTDGGTHKLFARGSIGALLRKALK